MVIAELCGVGGAEARLVLSRTALDSLPASHALMRREGHATASIGRMADGGIVVTATCDSLGRQLMMYEEAYDALSVRYESLSDSLRMRFEARNKEDRKRSKPPDWVLCLVCLCAGCVLGMYVCGRRG